MKRKPLNEIPYLKHYDGGPIPNGWCVCCPKCEIWKMHPRQVGDVEVFQCAGTTGLASDGSDICGHIMTDLEVRLHKGLYIVEE